MEGKEGLSEARGECRLGLGDAVFGASHFGGVAGDEVEHGLLRGELGDGRQDAAGVAGEEDDVGRVASGEAGDLGFGDVVNWVGTSGILRESGVVVICLAGFGVEDDVFEDRAESDGVEDVGLLFGGEVDAFGVALVKYQHLGSHFPRVEKHILRPRC